MMAVMLPPPPSSMDRRLSRALSSSEDFVRPGPRPGPRPEPRLAAMDAFVEPPLLQVPSASWSSNVGGEKPEPPPQPRPFGGNDSLGGRRGPGRYKHIGIWTRDPVQSRSHGQRVPEFAVNILEPKPRIKSRTHRVGGSLATHTYLHVESSKSTVAPPDPVLTERGPEGGQVTTWEGRPGRKMHAITKLHEPHQGVGPHRGVTGQVSSEGFKKHLEEIPSTVKKKPTGSKPSSSQRHGSRVCGRFREQDFPDSDHRRIRMNRSRLPWFSRNDVQKMELLASGQVVSKATVPAHGQVLQVGLDPAGDPLQTPSVMGAAARPLSSHRERCRSGFCSLVKRTSDWFEVFAFHLDRVLGLNRSLPAVLRTFHGELLPYRYTSDTPRPVVWWDPGIRHLANGNNDQNSVALGWVRYQRLLKARCGMDTDLHSEPCVGIRHSEWGCLALFDFLLQVNDRLDRYCCGFTPDLSELCVENLLHAKCGHAKDLLLVHILVKEADPSRLVFIDNAGRPQQPTNNLNFRLIEGIDEFPEKAVSVLGSGCLESLLLRSLYTDREFWESRGGAGGLRPLVRTVEQRGHILLRHIQDKKLWLRSDL